MSVKIEMFVRKLIGDVRGDGMQRVELHDFLFSQLIGKESKLPAVKSQRVGSATYKEFEYDGVKIYSMYSYNGGSAFLMDAKDAVARLEELDKNSSVVFGVDFSDMTVKAEDAI